MGEDVNARRARIIDNIDSSDVTKLLLKRLAELSGAKPAECNSDDQHWMFMFLTRFGWTSFTLWRVFFPEPNYELQPKDSLGVILDVPAGCLIVRSLYENFLAAYHLVGQPISEERKQCRRLIWDWHAAKLRCDFAEHLDSAPHIAEPAAREFTVLDQQLKSDSVFKALPGHTRKEILDRESGLSHSHSKIASDAGIDIAFHRSMYGYLSAHAHCDSHSFRLYTQGDHKFMMDSLRMHFLQVSSLMFDLTRRFLYSKEINGDIVLSEVVEFGLMFVRDFKNLRKRDDDHGQR